MTKREHLYSFLRRNIFYDANLVLSLDIRSGLNFVPIFWSFVYIDVSPHPSRKECMCAYKFDINLYFMLVLYLENVFTAPPDERTSHFKTTFPIFFIGFLRNFH